MTKPTLLFAFTALFSFSVFSQNIGINTTGVAAASTNLLEVLQTSNTDATIGIYVNHSGGTGGTGTRYAMQAINNGASLNNIAAYLSASGGTNNYGLIVAAGNVGIGLTAPASLLHSAGQIRTGIPLGGLGGASATTGSLLLYNSANTNTVNIQSGTTSATYSLTLPTAQGGASTVLQNDGSGNLSWAAGGTVTSVTASSPLSSSGGATPNISITSPLPIANGGTNITTIGSAGSVTYSNGTQHASTAVGTSGQVLTSQGSGTPVWATSAQTLYIVTTRMTNGSSADGGCASPPDYCPTGWSVVTGWESNSSYSSDFGGFQVYTCTKQTLCSK